MCCPRPRSQATCSGSSTSTHTGKPGTPRILLIGHLDTVFEGPNQRFERVDSIARGAGSNDMKGGDGAWTQFLKQPAQQQAIRVIAYSTPIPNDNVAVSRDLDANLVKRVKQAFQQMARDPQSHKLLVTLYKIDNLVDAKDSDYNTVREAYRQTGARTH